MAKRVGRSIDIGLQEAIVCSDERFPAGGDASVHSALALTDLCPGLGCLPGTGGQMVVLGYFETFPSMDSSNQPAPSSTFFSPCPDQQHQRLAFHIYQHTGNCANSASTTFLGAPYSPPPAS